ncbi:hypothetical protein HK100_006480 [Physocladia obscura]|uniref:Uncharacterized protein n=1 Tax=Physocladia obscura TaxID=109957 RepID=A0AAD5T5E7_9FUNG|nr:hypothetical protein HK100_006480 [Physocladia obscura]
MSTQYAGAHIPSRPGVFFKGSNEPLSFKRVVNCSASAGTYVSSVDKRAYDTTIPAEFDQK